MKEEDILRISLDDGSVLKGKVTQKEENPRHPRNRYRAHGRAADKNVPGEVKEQASVSEEEWVSGNRIPNDSPGNLFFTDEKIVFERPPIMALRTSNFYQVKNVEKVG